MRLIELKVGRDGDDQQTSSRYMRPAERVARSGFGTHLRPDVQDFVMFELS